MAAGAGERAPVDGASDPLVDLVVEERGWDNALPDLHSIATRAAALALEAADLHPDGFAVALLACGDDKIAVLNAEFRGKPGATNVLSWPAFALAAPDPGAAPARPPPAREGGRLQLGDVAIAMQTVVREAESRGVPLKNHALHLILHGCLHLLGFDHETPEDAELMEGLERRSLARIGVPDPYA